MEGPRQPTGSIIHYQIQLRYHVVVGGLPFLFWEYMIPFMVASWGDSDSTLQVFRSIHVCSVITTVGCGVEAVLNATLRDLQGLSGVIMGTGWLLAASLPKMVLFEMITPVWIVSLRKTRAISA